MKEGTTIEKAAEVEGHPEIAKAGNIRITNSRTETVKNN